MLIMIITTPINFRVPHITQRNISDKTHNYNDQVNEVTGQTQMVKGTKSETEDTKDHHDSDSPISNFDSSSDSEWLSQTDEIIEVTISNMKQAVNFPVTINQNRTISLCDTGATISCMSKSCFDRLCIQSKTVPMGTPWSNWNDYMYPQIP